MVKSIDRLALKLLLFFIVFIVFVIENGGAEMESCPNMCKCNKETKKVVCNNRNLTSVNLEVPVNTEWLDMGNNFIATLDEQCFRVSRHTYDFIYVIIVHNLI